MDDIEDINALPPDLRDRSASPREIVLPLADARTALRLLRPRGYACLGWELWGRWPDGRVGHPCCLTETFEQEDGEPWGAYVDRSHACCERSLVHWFDERCIAAEFPKAEMLVNLDLVTEKQYQAL